MALTQEAINDAKLAEAKIANADSLSDDYKKNLLNLISISTTATNGITQEEKILRMTDAIRILAISQVDFVTTIQDTIVRTIKEVNTEKCITCKAMKHADAVEKAEEHKKLLEDWKRANGIIDSRSDSNAASDGTGTVQAQLPSASRSTSTATTSWIDLIKKTVTQPGLWVFLIFLVISPYSFNIIKALLEFFSR